MSKIAVMSFIISFWVILPIVFAFAGIGGFEDITEDFRVLETQEKPTAITQLTIVFSMIGYFFKTIFIWVYGIPTVFNVFLWILRIISAFILILTIRGTE